MSQRPQPSCRAMSVARVTGQGARSVPEAIRGAPASKSSEMLLVVLRRQEVVCCSASCSELETYSGN